MIHMGLNKHLKNAFIRQTDVQGEKKEKKILLLAILITDMEINCAVLDSWVRSINLCMGLRTWCFFQIKSDQMKVLFMWAHACMSYYSELQKPHFYLKDKRRYWWQPHSKEMTDIFMAVPQHLSQTKVNLQTHKGWKRGLLLPTLRTRTWWSWIQGKRWCYMLIQLNIYCNCTGKLDEVNWITHLFLPVYIQQLSVNIYHMSGTAISAGDTKINEMQLSHPRIYSVLGDTSLQQNFAVKHNISLKNQIY